jgi:hypothetical protein
MKTQVFALSLVLLGVVARAEGAMVPKAVRK